MRSKNLGASASGTDSTKPKRKRKMPPKDTAEYLEKRARNNEAVKKSREKAKYKATNTIDKVNKLKEENMELEQQVSILGKELGILKDLFVMAHNGSGECSQTGTVVSVNNDSTENEDHSNADKQFILEEVVEETLVVGDMCNPEANSIVNFDALKKDHEYISPAGPMLPKQR